MSTDKLFRITWYDGLVELPKIEVHVLRSEPHVAATLSIGGCKVVFSDDLPRGALAVLGHRKPDGSFTESSVILSQ